MVKTRTKWVWLSLALLIFLAAGSLRIAYLVEIRSTPELLYPSIDAAYHKYWAGGLATGRWIPAGGREDPQIYRYPYYRPPGYAYCLAGIYALAGVKSLAPQVFQAFTGLFCAFLAFVLARRWFGPLAALLAGAGMGFYWIFIYFEGELLGVSLSILLVLALLGTLGRAAVRGSFICRASAGILLGLLALFRPNAALVGLLLAGWLSWADRRRERNGWAGPVIFLLCSLIPVSFSAARNYLVSGEIVPIANNAGISIGVANNDYTDGTNHYIPGIGDVGTPFDWPAVVRGMERARGMSPGSLPHSRASSILVKQAMDWIVEHPGYFSALLNSAAASSRFPESVQERPRS